MSLINYVKETVSAIGGTYTVPLSSNLDVFYLSAATSPVVMLGNIVVNFSGTPTDGQTVRVGWGDGFDLNGNTFTVNGVSVTANQALKGGCYLEFYYIGGGWTSIFTTDLGNLDSLDGGVLLDGSVALGKIGNLTDGSLVAGGASNIPTELTVAGVLSAVRSGATLVFSFVAGSITNAAISASAAIARTKIASGTASHVLINDGSGVMSSEAQLAKSRGGFGQDVSASTGFPTFSSGTLTIGSIVDSRDYQVSFESGEVGADNTYTLGFDCTLVPSDCSAFVIKAIAGTDDAVITLLKNGVAISSGTITFAASSAQDASGVFGAFSATSFTAGDTISLQSSKPTAGGKVCVTLQFTRTQ